MANNIDLQGHNERSLVRIAALGLAIGGAGGLAGTLVDNDAARQLLWGADGIGLIVATVLLALQFFKRDSLYLAAGFMIFALGESLIFAGNSATSAVSRPTFAAGILLWSTAVAMISIPPVFSKGTRTVGIVATFLFAYTGLQILLGAPLGATSQPLPFFGYPFLVLTFVGWIWDLLVNRVAEKP